MLLIHFAVQRVTRLEVSVEGFDASIADAATLQLMEVKVVGVDGDVVSGQLLAADVAAVAQKGRRVEHDASDLFQRSVAQLGMGRVEMGEEVAEAVALFAARGALGDAFPPRFRRLLR